MAISDLQVPFPDFKLSEIINPEEFDQNNQSLVTKIEQIIAIVNQITDSVTNGSSGADKISLTPIAPFLSNKLQSYLGEIVMKLKSSKEGLSGSEFIGSPAIAGTTGLTVYDQLVSLKTVLDLALTNHKNAAVLDHPDGSVTTAKLADGGVTTAKLGDSQVTTNKIADSQITTVKVADLSIITEKMVDLSITTGKIAVGAITTEKLADGAVTSAKLDAAIAETGGAALNSHMADPLAHGASVSPTNLSFMKRDENGRSQIATPIDDDDISTKKYVDDNISASSILTKIKTVDGTGSLLDADTVDGSHASDFVLKSGTTMTGVLNAKLNTTDVITDSLLKPIVVQSDSTHPALMTFIRQGVFANHLGIDTDNQWKVGGWSSGALSYKLWHQGNDGAGSGLDADTLDGYHLSSISSVKSYIEYSSFIAPTTYGTPYNAVNTTEVGSYVYTMMGSTTNSAYLLYRYDPVTKVLTQLASPPDYPDHYPTIDGWSYQGLATNGTDLFCVYKGNANNTSVRILRYSIGGNSWAVVLENNSLASGGFGPTAGTWSTYFYFSTGITANSPYTWRIYRYNTQTSALNYVDIATGSSQSSTPGGLLVGSTYLHVPFAVNGDVDCFRINLSNFTLVAGTYKIHLRPTRRTPVDNHLIGYYNGAIFTSTEVGGVLKPSNFYLTNNTDNSFFASRTGQIIGNDSRISTIPDMVGW